MLIIVGQPANLYGFRQTDRQAETDRQTDRQTRALYLSIWRRVIERQCSDLIEEWRAIIAGRSIGINGTGTWHLMYIGTNAWRRFVRMGCRSITSPKVLTQIRGTWNGTWTNGVQIQNRLPSCIWLIPGRIMPTFAAYIWKVTFIGRG